MTKLYLFKYVIDGEIYYYGYKNDSVSGIVRSTDELSMHVTHLLYEKNTLSDAIQIVHDHVGLIYDLIGKMLFDMVSNNLYEKCDIHSYNLLYEVTDFSGICINVAVLHDDFTITNTNEQKYIIKGLMSKLIYRITDSGTVILWDVRGVRTKLTYFDKQVHYKHSHLRSGLSEENYCLGISDLRTRRQTNVALSNFDIVYDISILESFVRWESLEGGPHYRMKDMFQIRSVSTDVSNVELTEELIDRINVKMLFDRPSRMFRSKVELNITNTAPIDISTDTDEFYAYRPATNYCVTRTYLMDNLPVKRDKFRISQQYYFKGHKNVETTEFTKEEIDLIVNSFFTRQLLNATSIQSIINNIVNNDIYRPTIAEEIAI